MAVKAKLKINAVNEPVVYQIVPTCSAVTHNPSTGEYSPTEIGANVVAISKDKVETIEASALAALGYSAKISRFSKDNTTTPVSSTNGLTMQGDNTAWANTGSFAIELFKTVNGSTVLADKETVPVIEIGTRGEKGEKGDQGEPGPQGASSIVIDLTNEFESVLCTADGYTKGTRDVSTILQAFEGNIQKSLEDSSITIRLGSNILYDSNHTNGGSILDGAITLAAPSFDDNGGLVCNFTIVDDKSFEDVANISFDVDFQ